MYFEILKNDKVIKRGTDTLNSLSWSNELMYVPTLSVTLPLDYKDFVDGREEMKVYVNGKVFWGIVKDIAITDVLNLTLEHVVSEWRYRQISVNHAVDDGKLNVIYKGDQTKKSAENDEAITASNFSIRVSDVKKMTDADMIARAYAKAWRISTTELVTVHVDRTKLKAKEGTYKVRFYTSAGTEITVDATVSSGVTYGKTRKNKGASVTIQASDFTISADNVSELGNGTLITIAKAKAWRTGNKKESVAITSVTSNVEEEAGTYSVTFAAGADVTIQVEVTEESKEPSIVDTVEDIYSDNNFAYPGWNIDYQDDAGAETIDYVYSRQNKLDALTKTMELTKDLFWRVGFTDEKVIEIGRFGEVKSYIVSERESGRTNIRILEEPEITYNFDNVVNVATVYGEKSDSGMSSLTLRDICIDESLQDKDFPVIILRGNVNNERDYTKYLAQYPALAPNNEREYAVIDIESVRLEGGKLIEGTYSFNDLGTFNTDSQKITDARRLRAEKQAYSAAIRKLKQARRSVSIKITTEELPADLNVGDKVRLVWERGTWHLEACSKYFKKVLTEDDYFYITSIGYEITESEVETNTLTLSKSLRIERELQD